MTSIPSTMPRSRERRGTDAHGCRRRRGAAAAPGARSRGAHAAAAACDSHATDRVRSPSTASRSSGSTSASSRAPTRVPRSETSPRSAQCTAGTSSPARSPGWRSTRSRRPGTRRAPVATDPNLVARGPISLTMRLLCHITHRHGRNRGVRTYGASCGRRSGLSCCCSRSPRAASIPIAPRRPPRASSRSARASPHRSRRSPSRTATGIGSSRRPIASPSRS